VDCSSLAQLVTDTLNGLGNPDVKYCTVEDAARAVVHSIALLKQSASFSRQNLEILNYEWEASAREEQLLALDACLPLWVERKVDQDYWRFVPTCNLSVLEDARMRGDFRCAFFSEDGVLKVRFSYLPTDLAFRTHRLRYEPSLFNAETFSDILLDSQGTGISSAFFPLVSALAELELIPTMKIKAAQEPNPNVILINAWTDRQDYLAIKAAEWHRRYRQWAFGERSGIRGRRRRSLVAKGIGI